MHGLKPRWISARETGFYLFDLEPRPGRVGIAMDDPNEVGVIGLVPLTGDLDRDPLARPRGEAVEIADQRNHHVAPSLFRQVLGGYPNVTSWPVSDARLMASTRW